MNRMIVKIFDQESDLDWRIWDLLRPHTAKLDHPTKLIPLAATTMRTYWSDFIARHYRSNTPGVKA